MTRRTDCQCRKCGGAMEWYGNVCGDCSSRLHFHSRYVSGSLRAQGLVAKARRQGVLADPRTFPCTDCKGAATEYDHRDYNKPLEVEPVCRGCNARRGRALPKQWLPGEWAAYVERSANINTATRGVLVDLHARFSHELRPDIFGEQGRAQ